MDRKINLKNAVFVSFLYYSHKKQKRGQKFVEIAMVDRIISVKEKNRHEIW